MTNKTYHYMENENQDVDLLENNEAPEENLDTPEDNKEETPEDRPKETPEAKLARLKRQTSQLEKRLGLDRVETPKTDKKSNDLDWGQKAFLTANGVKGSKEFDFVKNELKASGEDLDSLLENDYFQARLEKFRNLNKTSDAIPKGNRSGGVAIDSVEYWAAKPIEEVPADMRIKVVNHKLSKEQNQGKFYNS